MNQYHVGSKNNRRCCIPTCLNHTKNCPPGTIFYRFPTNNPEYPHRMVRRKNWIQFTGLRKYVSDLELFDSKLFYLPSYTYNYSHDGSTWEPTEYSRICSRHFEGNKKSEHPGDVNYNPKIYYVQDQVNNEENNSFSTINGKLNRFLTHPKINLLKRSSKILAKTKKSDSSYKLARTSTSVNISDTSLEMNPTSNNVHEEMSVSDQTSIDSENNNPLMDLQSDSIPVDVKDFCVQVDLQNQELSQETFCMCNRLIYSNSSSSDAEVQVNIKKCSVQQNTAPCMDSEDDSGRNLEEFVSAVQDSFRQHDISHENEITHEQSNSHEEDVFCEQDVFQEQEISHKQDIFQKHDTSYELDTSYEQSREGFYGYKTLEGNEQAIIDLCGVTEETFKLLVNISFSDDKDDDRKKVSNSDKILIFLMKMKLALTYSALAAIFQLHRTTVAIIFKTVLQILFMRCKNVVSWPNRELVSYYMPEVFKPDFEKCRVIIDCTEFETEQPYGIGNRVSFYSHYKKGFRVKVLVGCTPDGHVSFVSKCYGGRITDCQITVHSGFINMLEPGDMVLADKGFPEIASVLKANDKYQLIVMPPFLKGKEFTAEEVRATRRIASVRVHIERIMQRIRIYKIVDFFTHDLLPFIDEIIFVCCVLVNFQPPILKVDEAQIQ